MLNGAEIPPSGVTLGIDRVPASGIDVERASCGIEIRHERYAVDIDGERIGAEKPRYWILHDEGAEPVRCHEGLHRGPDCWRSDPQSGSNRARLGIETNWVPGMYCAVKI